MARSEAEEQTYYDGLFSGEAALAAEWSLGDRFDRISVRAMLGRRPNRLLDLGCGIGHFLGERSASHAVGLDFALPSLAEARRRLPGIAWLAGDATRLPFRDGSFDAVVSLDLLEHIPDDHEVFREVLRVLRPGGVFVIHVPGHHAGAISDEMRDRHHHHRNYNRAAIEARATCGFEIEDLYYMGTTANVIWLPLRRPLIWLNAIHNLIDPRNWPYYWRLLRRRPQPPNGRRRTHLFRRGWYRRILLPVLFRILLPLDRRAGEGETWWWRRFGGNVNARLRKTPA